MNERIDITMVKKGLCDSRSKAKETITSGNVWVDDVQISKPSQIVSAEKSIELRGNVCPYVSRGGYKLEKAIQQFKIDVQNKVAVDIGASTGGFTDCLLQHGAKKVFAIDVGSGQLSESLRENARVVNIEKVNARHLTSALFDEMPELAVMDVSFISVLHILPSLIQCIAPDAKILLLVKPQFEAGTTLLVKKGIVKSKKTHIQVLSHIIMHSTTLNLASLSIAYSPITGQNGNIEFLLYLTKEKTESQVSASKIEEVVHQAHKNLR